MRLTLQRPAPPPAWYAEHTAVRVTPSIALQRARLASEAARAPRFVGEMHRSPSSSTTAARATPNDSTSSPQTRVLMVCLGNICRSPAAEAVLDHLVKKRKLGDSVFVDSCGTVRSVLVSFGSLRVLFACFALLTLNFELKNIHREEAAATGSKKEASATTRETPRTLECARQPPGAESQ